MLLVQILGLTADHQITSVHMRLAEWVIKGFSVALANMMLACIYEKLGCYVGGVGFFCFNLVLMAFFFEHIPLLWLPEVV